MRYTPQLRTFHGWWNEKYLENTIVCYIREVQQESSFIWYIAISTQTDVFKLHQQQNWTLQKFIGGITHHLEHNIMSQKLKIYDAIKLVRSNESQVSSTVHNMYK